MTVQPSPPPSAGASGFGEASTRKNWLGILSLVLGLTCFGMVGVIVGHAALRAVARGDASNRGIAVAGLTASYVNIAAFIALVAWGSAQDSAPWSAPVPGGSGESGLHPVGSYSAAPSPSPDDLLAALDTSVESSDAWFGVSVGDCVADYRDSLTTDGESLVFHGMDVVPCDQAHYAEVYVIAELATDRPPRDDDAWTYLRAACEGEAFADYVGVDFASTQLTYAWLYPADSWWLEGNHQLVCMVTNTDASVVGSLRGVAR